MSRFVDDEEAEIQVGSGLSGVEEKVKKDAPRGEKDADADEGGAAATIATEDSGEDDRKNSHHHYRKRKSLQEQLLNNRMYKYRERRKKLEKQNSSFKMRKDTREFYGKLSAEKQAKKQAERETYERELALFRREKEKQQRLRARQSEIQEPPQESKKPDKKESPVRVVAYSDSDSE